MMITRLALLSGSALAALAASPAFAEGAVAPAEPSVQPPALAPASSGQPSTPAAATPAEAHAGGTTPASTANQDVAGGEDAAPDTIVITATRREANVQDVPIPVSVMSGATIAESGTQNISQLTQLQPSIAYYGTNPRNAAINIRGLGAPLGLTNDGLEQGVGVYIDQVYYSRIANAVFDLFDVQRVEVLRGPQGTLFGKNTTAGAINVIT